IRDPLYLETAHIVIDTGGRSINTIVHQLEEALTKHANAHR
ncbi:MAG: shikimate kinase, partial [Methylobacterium sp.]|nr:shikimate kinase [Methylobacterium sp.]